MALSNSIKTTILVALSLFAVSCANKTNPDTLSASNPAAKELYIPAKVYYVPDSNDYNNPQSTYSYSRMVQSANLALFWDKEYGTDPMANPDSTKRFNPTEALNECERFYEYYVNNLKIVKKDSSVTDKYKMLIYVFGGPEGTAFGGGEEDKIGILWTPAVRIHKKPYGALAHEMAHSFQYVAAFDNGVGPDGPIMEMSAQYMLWQVYPEWMTFENYHLKAFMEGTHYAFLHPKNMYHSPYVLEYWSQKHGVEFFGNLCRATQKGDDPVATYKRMNNLTQAQFNDEMFEASRRFITWDMERIQDVAKPYRNQHITKLDSVGNGWYQIDSAVCPQNYGYNGIKLKVPAKRTLVEVEFKGMAGAPGFSAVQVDKAGWRYGFVAYLKNGKRVYSNMFGQANGKATFKVPKNTEYLWLVVSGAPTEHWPVVFGWDVPADTTPDEQWPYQIKLSGTSLDNTVTKVTL